MPQGSWLGLSSPVSSTPRAVEWEPGEVVRVLEVRSPPSLGVAKFAKFFSEKAPLTIKKKKLLLRFRVVRLHAF